MQGTHQRHVYKKPHTTLDSRQRVALPSVGDKILGQRQGGAVRVVREPSVLVKRTDPIEGEHMVFISAFCVRRKKVRLLVPPATARRTSKRSQCLTRYSMRRGEVLQMHFALRVGGMAACSAGGSTATFKKYATIEALQKPVQSTNSSWRKRILRHG